MTYTESLAALNTTLDDTGNITFSSDQKDRALTKAWNDAYVVKNRWDSTLTFSTGTYIYTIPTALTTVKDIFIAVSASDNPEPIDADMWEIIDGSIHFDARSRYIIPDATTINCKGNYKLTTSDTLDNVGLQEYVIALASVETISLLLFKKANLFLKNDVSVGELVTIKREMERTIQAYRSRLVREYESA
jgi:hypothetical protein